MEEIYAYPRDTLNIAADGENTVMNTWDDLADAGLDASLIPDLRDILPALANDDACIFCTDESAESESVVAGLRARAGVGLRRGF